jgi:hypothetical protein
VPRRAGPLRVAIALLGLSVTATPALGQQGVTECRVTPAALGQPLDLCQKASDLFAFLAPQAGLAVAGGNFLPGEGGSLGGFGVRSASLRVVAVDGRVPDRRVPLDLGGTAVASDFGAARTVIPMPALDVGIGLFRGWPVGLSNVGGIDLLLGVTALPRVARSAVEIGPQGSALAWSWGARVGLLQESSFIPGLGVSLMRRRVPSMQLRYTPADDSLLVDDGGITSRSVRVTMSKRFTFIGLAAGVGRDQLEATGAVRAVVNTPGAGAAERLELALPGLRDAVSRNTAFVNVALGYPMLRLVAEVGWSGAGDLRRTVNSFGARTANEGCRYGSLGLGVRF